MRQVIGIVDYDSGNIRSVVNAVEAAGATAHLLRTRERFLECSHVILPGVGAFGFCANRLQASGLLPALERWATIDKKPLLGICVGMQLMADYSEEQGRHAGLGWIGGAVKKLLVPENSSTRIPHVGWNEVVFTASFGQFARGDTANFYFDHSFAYHAPAGRESLGVCTHGSAFTAAVRHDNIIGVQFHPEKSQAVGMRLLKSFLAM